jgi:hypothetical protein
LNITDPFELINLDQPIPWTTVRRDDLVVNGAYNCHPLTENVDDSDQQEIESLEIRKPLNILNDDLQIITTPSNQKLNIKQIYTQITDQILPIFIYIIDQEILSEKDIEELREFRSIVPNEPILFIRIDQNDT